MLGGTNLKNFLAGGTRNRELAETKASWERVQALWRTSPLSQKPLDAFAVEVVQASVAGETRRPVVAVLAGVAYAVEKLLSAESIGDIEPIWDLIENDVAVAAEFRRVVARRQRWVLNFVQMYGAFKDILFRTLTELYRELPESCFDPDAARASDTFEVPLIDLLDDPVGAVDRLFMLPYHDSSFRLGLFEQLREQCANNLLSASGFPPDKTNIREVADKLVRAPEQKKKTGAELASLYLFSLPFKDLLEVPVPFRIPEEVRFEHCHIVGGTGHGKTQLMQKMIHTELIASKEDGRSIVVIDSQGDLINKLVRLELFDPDQPDALADRLVLIDPADIEFPAALNLFDAHLSRLDQYRPADKERVLNGVIELYELFFGAFLGAELTQKQGVIFKYLARLMLAIPGATIYTLMEIMEDGKRFQPYIDLLDGSARYFFETEFFHPSFAATKKQVVRRLWGVLSTPAFERMFTQPQNKLDLFQAMNEGKIILVSTAKDLLKREGSQLLGRFFIAMLTQAALERSTIPERLRNSVSVYVDEAQEYFDDSIETILNQARKYKVGITLAHQTLDQLSPRLRSAIFSNTSFKCVGGVSAKDARALADELHTTPAFIEGMKRRGERSEFATWVKHRTGQAIRLSVELGYLERQPTLTEEAYDDLLAANRIRYCGTLTEVSSFRPSPTIVQPEKKPVAPREPESAPEPPIPRPPAAEAPAPPKVPDVAAQILVAETAPIQKTPRHSVEYDSSPTRQLGKGGPKHRYLQSLVKELAEATGLKATIEAPLPTGGQVDVLIERGNILAAVEISVSTPLEHERENLRKCLAAEIPRIAIVLAKSRASQSNYRAALSETMPDADRERVVFLSPEGIAGFVESLAPPPAPTERIVRGYRVKGSLVATDSQETRARRDALARLIAKSLSSQDRS